MPTPTIRGDKVDVRLFENGELKVIGPLTRISINQESNPTRHFYVGNVIPEGDQSISGYSGSLDYEARNRQFNDFFDRMEKAIQTGVAVPSYTMVVTERYNDGTHSIYAYADMQFTFSVDAAGLQEKVMKRVNWQASSRSKIS